MNPLITIDDVAVEYGTARGAVRALDGASAEIQAGEIIGIVGESGSGKSTLGLAIAGLLPGNAKWLSGAIHVGGHDVRGHDEVARREFRRRQCGFIFQNAMGALDPTMRVHRQLEHALDGEGGDAAVAALAASVGLPTDKAVLRRYPHEFSGGMAQRAVIAKAIAARPRIVVADEPTASLDAAMRTQVLELLVSLRDDLGLTCVLLSHDLGLVMRYCDRIAVMYSGRVVEYGSPETVLSRPAHPYTNALLRAAPGKEAPGTRVEPIPGMQVAVRSRSERCAFADRCRRAEERCAAERPEPREVDGRQVLCHFAEEEVMVAHG